MEMLDVADIFKLDITLQKLSTAVVAVYLWELKSVKNKIFEVFNAEDYDPTERTSYEGREIFKYVIKLVPLLGVPEKLSEEIKNYVYIIGGLIFGFMEYITGKGLDVAFGMNICWAPYGRIDEVKMCKSFIKNSCEGQVLEDRFLCLARVYTDVDLVRPHMRKIREKFKKAKDRNYKIFQHCLENSNLYFAARYFWRDLDLDITKKQKIVVNCAQKFLCLVLEEEYDSYQYFEQVNTELLVFFMREMSEIQLSDFVTKNYVDLFKAFLKSWPHQELCGNIIDLYNNVNDNDGSYMEKYFFPLQWILTGFDYAFRTYKHKNVFHSILQKLLEKSPDEIKQNYFHHKSMYPENIFKDLTQYKNWVALSTILNDGSLKKLKEDVVYGFEIDELLRDRVLRGSFKFVNNFLKYVVFTEEEIKLFKRKIDWINRFASEGNIKAADRVLNWACDTDEERKERKEDVHPLEVGKFIVQGRYDIAEEFVNWLYGTEVERKDAKKMLYKLDRRDPLKHCTGLFHKMEFKEIDQYLTWRYSEEEERQNIRKALRALDKNDPKEICEDLIGENGSDYYKDIEKARFYLKLRFETEEERRDFKKELYKSEEYLLEKCRKVLIPKNPNRTVNFHRGDYFECFAMLKFFLETEEAVVEFETNNIFTEEFFLKHVSDMPFKNFEEFLQFRDEMRKAIDEGKKNMWNEKICYQFQTDRRYNSSPC